MQPNLHFIANFRDATRPVLVITNPIVNQRWSNAVFVASGKASDHMGVSNVWYQVDGGNWLPATLALNRTNWSTADWTLFSGSNIVQAFAADAAGNNSLTSSVKFMYLVQPVADWAPDSLNGLNASVVPEGSAPISASFDPGNFSQTGGTKDDFSLGLYTYAKLSTNTAWLTLTDNGPGVSPQTNDIALVFTNHYSGVFSNGSGMTGSLSLVIATNFLPGSLAGKTITAIESGSGQTNTIKLLNSVAFTKTPANSGGPGTSAGTYTLMRFSPVCGLLTFTFTNTVDVGQTAYVQATFTNASSGVYFIGNLKLGVLQDSGIGKFKMQ